MRVGRRTAGRRRCHLVVLSPCLLRGAAPADPHQVSIIAARFGALCAGCGVGPRPRLAFGAVLPHARRAARRGTDGRRSVDARAGRGGRRGRRPRVPGRGLPGRPSAVVADIEEVRRGRSAPFGVNVFLPGAATPDPAGVAAYRDRLAPQAAALGVEPGEPRWDDDEVDAKLAAVAGVPLVSLTFGCPSTAVVGRCSAAGSAVARDGDQRAEASSPPRSVHPDALWLQGGEAGAHRGRSPTTTRPPRGCRWPAAHRRTGRHRAAACRGRRADGRRRRPRRVLDRGATWAAMGTAFLGCPEAGHLADAPGGADRPALHPDRDDAGVHRPAARALVNDVPARARRRAAPRGYPEVHHVTRPIRTRRRPRPATPTSCTCGPARAGSGCARCPRPTWCARWPQSSDRLASSWSAGHEDAEQVAGRVGVDPQRLVRVVGAVVAQPRTQGQRPLVLPLQLLDGRAPTCPGASAAARRPPARSSRAASSTLLERKCPLAVRRPAAPASPGRARPAPPPAAARRRAGSAGRTCCR